MEIKEVIKMLEMALMDVQPDITKMTIESTYEPRGVGILYKIRYLIKQTNGLWECVYSTARKPEDATYFSVSCFCKEQGEIDNIIDQIIEYDCDGYAEILDYKITLE